MVVLSIEELTCAKENKENREKNSDQMATEPMPKQGVLNFKNLKS
jgi:hypothetical protein